MAKKIFKNKSLWKKIGIGAIAGVLGIGAIMGVGALLNKEEETTKVIKPAYEIGALTEDGKYQESVESIYTKDAFECKGLDIDMDFKSNISYRVFFYNDDNSFLSSTGKLTENYDETSTPELATHCRIVITPNDDDKISWYEKNGYANQLTIEVAKDQTHEVVDYFSLNENEVGFYSNQAVGEKFAKAEEDTTKQMAMSNLIKVDGWNELEIVCHQGNWNGGAKYFFLDENENIIATSQYTFSHNDGSAPSNKVISVPEGAKYFTCVVSTTRTYSVFIVS